MIFELLLQRKLSFIIGGFLGHNQKFSHLLNKFEVLDFCEAVCKINLLVFLFNF